MRIAIIGAGMAGITAARALPSSAKITIFEKSRGVSGRMSTRRADAFEFDHGAQYFTAKNPRFQAFVLDAISTGHVAPWLSEALYRRRDGVVEPDRGADRFVATPRMNMWVKAIAEGFDVNLQMRVASLKKHNRQWVLTFEDGSVSSGFDGVIMAVPAEQAVALVPKDFAHLDALHDVQMDACFALMIAITHDSLTAPWGSMRQAVGGPAGWIAVNSRKPHRPEAHATIMVHSGPQWSEANIDTPREDVQVEMLASASQIMDMDLSQSDYMTLHFWRYASVHKGAETGGQGCLVDAGQRLVVAGDWCHGGRVEGAYLSGLAAANAIQAALG